MLILTKMFNIFHKLWCLELGYGLYQETKSQNRCSMMCTLTNNNEYFDIKAIEIGSGVKAGEHSKGRGCF